MITINKNNNNRTCQLLGSPSSDPGVIFPMAAGIPQMTSEIIFWSQAMSEQGGRPCAGVLASPAHMKTIFLSSP